MNFKRLFKWLKRKTSSSEDHLGVSVTGANTPLPRPKPHPRSSSSSSVPPYAISALVFHPLIHLPVLPHPAPDGTATIDTTDAPRTSLSALRKLLAKNTVDIGPVGAVLDSLLWLFTTNMQLDTREKEYKLLCAEFDALFQDLHICLSEGTAPVITTSICNICSAIQAELAVMREQHERNKLSRFLQSSQDLDEDIGCYRRIQTHLVRLTLNISTRAWKIVDEIKTEAFLNKIIPAMSASFDSAEAALVRRRECTPHTREQVLLDLNSWKLNQNGEKVCWLSGMAGTGKTTIATTMCKSLDACHELGASFFCTRSLPECRNVRFIMPTIAYQLARFSRPFRNALSQILERDPDVHTKALRTQFERMVVEPLQDISSTLPTSIVIVIDALDECEDSDGVEQILQVLLEHASKSPIKFLVSSRPEPHIREKIGQSTMKAQLTLHELEEKIVKADIDTYLRKELESISLTEDELATLVERAGVWFIYAATVVRYIRGVGNLYLAPKRLHAVLQESHPGASTTNRNKEIDSLYGLVLGTALDNPDLEPTERKQMELVLHTVVCAQEPLLVNALASLLSFDPTETKAALHPLWSVLQVSGAGEMERVSTLHASFADYMLDSNRSKLFACDSAVHNGKIAELCFERIERNTPQFNICGLESSHVFDEDVPNMDNRLKKSVPLELLYSCQYWAVHLELGEKSAYQVRKLSEFLSQKLLLWIEVLNLTKRLVKGIESLEKTKRWLQGHASLQPVEALAHDSWRFIITFATSSASKSTPHLYVSMLNFWPESQPVSQCYMQWTSRLVGIRGIKDATRQHSLLSTIPIPAGSHANCVQFSPTGALIAAGTEDGVVLLWDAQGCKMTVDPLRGHTAPIKAIVFSPDGAQICSGSEDGTLLIWDPRKGLLIAGPLRGHSGKVLSVDYSPDGLWLVSGSDDGTMRIWNTQNESIAKTPLVIGGNDGPILSVMFSPDGSFLASGSESAINLWDYRSGRHIERVLGENTGAVKAISFSPNSRHLVSGSGDGAVRVWDVESKTVASEPFRDPPYPPRTVAFSRDGTLLAAATALSIRVWGTHTWRTLCILRHTDWVHSVAFSPDSSRLVSVSEDKSVRVWDLRDLDKYSVESGMEGHSDWVRSVVFSPCGSFVISGSDDCTVRTWNAQSGRPAGSPFTTHSRRIFSAIISSDGTRVISGSEDRTIRGWGMKNEVSDSVIGPIGEPSVWREHEIWPVAFSPDGRHLVSGYAEGIIRMWNAYDGELVFQIKGHADLVSTVSFSPDGQQIISSSWDRTLRVWDASDGRPKKDPVKGHSDRVYALAIFPDGSKIVSSSEDMTLRIWSLQSGQPMCDPIRGHTSGVHSVAVSFDGAYLVSGSRDKTVRLWDSNSGRPITTFQGHTDMVCSVGFSPDNTIVVSGSGDMTIRFWNAQVGPLLLENNHSPESSKDQPESLGYFTKDIPDLNWSMNEGGWVHDGQNRLFLWVPPDLRDVLLRPQNTMLISSRGCIGLEFSKSSIGDAWVNCYQPFADRRQV